MSAASRAYVAPNDSMTWEELLAHPALTFDPNAEVTALLLADQPALPPRPWLYDASRGATASGEKRS